MSEEQRPRPTIGEGLRAGIGILTAFKEAIEETIDEAAARQDLRPERAKEALTGALSRAQDALEGVRERLDVVPRREFDALRAELEELRLRVERLEGGGHARLLDAGAGPLPVGAEPAG